MVCTQKDVMFVERWHAKMRASAIKDDFSYTRLMAAWGVRWSIEVVITLMNGASHAVIVLFIYNFPKDVCFSYMRLAYKMIDAHGAIACWLVNKCGNRGYEWGVP